MDWKPNPLLYHSFYPQNTVKETSNEPARPPIPNLGPQITLEIQKTKPNSSDSKEFGYVSTRVKRMSDVVEKKCEPSQPSVSNPEVIVIKSEHNTPQDVIVIKSEHNTPQDVIVINDENEIKEEPTDQEVHSSYFGAKSPPQGGNQAAGGPGGALPNGRPTETGDMMNASVSMPTPTSTENCEKRSRAPKFSKEDQALLLNAAKAYTHVIENRHASQSEKQNAWDDITNMFKAHTKGPPRTTRDLIICYRNLQRRLRRSTTQVVDQQQKPSTTPKAKAPPSPPRASSSAKVGQDVVRPAPLDGHDGTSPYMIDAKRNETQTTQVQLSDLQRVAATLVKEISPYLSRDRRLSSEDASREYFTHKKTKSEKKKEKKQAQLTTKLLRLQIQNAEMEMKHKELMYQREAERADLERKHKDIMHKTEMEELNKRRRHDEMMREREYELIKLKIQKESSGNRMMF